MDRMKTFLIYLLIIIAFFFVSRVLENGLIKQMYYNIDGLVNGNLEYAGKALNLDIQVQEAKATRRNGYIDLKIENTSSTYISEAYIKVDLYSKSGVHAITKYMEISELSQGQTQEYKLNFGGSYINRYEITLSSIYPEKHYIINFFGYDINTSDIFGMDISSYINADNVKSFGTSIYESIVFTVRDIPWWGWLWAWCIVVGVV